MTIVSDPLSASTHEISTVEAMIRNKLETDGIVSSWYLRRRCGATRSSGQMLTAACHVLTEMSYRIEKLENQVACLSAATTQDDCFAMWVLDDDAARDAVDLHTALAG